MTDLRRPYTVRFVPPEYVPHARNDNADVEVIFEDGVFFSATFFTLENVKQLMAKNRATGECASGLYLYAKEMIIIDELTIGNVTAAVVDLIQHGEFQSAFAGPYPQSV